MSEFYDPIKYWDSFDRHEYEPEQRVLAGKGQIGCPLCEKAARKLGIKLEDQGYDHPREQDAD